MAATIEIFLQQDECELLREFLQETEEILADVEDRVLQMEGVDGRESQLVQDVFRMIHTIKGTAGFFALNFLERLSHRVENLLDAIRQGRKTVDADVTDCLLAGMDRLRRIVEVTARATLTPVRREDGVAVVVERVETADVLEWLEQEMRADAPRSAGEMPETAAPETPRGAEEEAAPAREPEEAEAGGEAFAYVFPEELCKDFLVEVRENLAAVETALLAAEAAGPASAGGQVDAALRNFHTVKGTSGLLLSYIEDEKAKARHILSKVHDLTHDAESLLHTRKNRGEAPVATDIALLLRVHDTLAGLIKVFAGGGHVGGADVRQLLRECAAAVAAPVVPLTSGIGGTLTVSVEVFAAGLARIHAGEKSPDAAARMQAAMQELHAALASHGMETLASKAADACSILEFLSNDWNEEVERFSLPELDALLAGLRAALADMAATAKPAARPVPAGEEGAAPAEEARGPEPFASVIKVPQHRLDQLMNLVGELMVNRNALTHLAKRGNAEARQAELAGDLKSLAGSFSHVVDEMEATVRAMRMMPVGHAFAKMPRMVRDLSRKLEKNIRLEMEGADIEVDKNVVEALGEPLVHLVRNCADHGLETAAGRKAAGKPEECVIRLRAHQEGKHVLVDVIDDGRGIDAGCVREKALRKGLADAETLARMSDAEVRNFIFVPGFSTAAAVTVVSGRGVGMDVVRRCIEAVGGRVEVVSEPGRGTTVSMALPLSLSVHRGLDVSCGGEHFYIPIEYVVETVRVPQSAIHLHCGAAMVEVRGRTLRLLDLARIMEIHRHDGGPAESRFCSLVILDLGKMLLALRVERFYREGEYVLKNLPGAFAGMTLVQGTMITPEGKLILVLDPTQLLDGLS